METGIYTHSLKVKVNSNLKLVSLIDAIWSEWKLMFQSECVGRNVGYV